MTDGELTDAAKAAIADAIRIVREDKFEKYARTALGKHATPPPTPPPTPPSNDPVPRKSTNPPATPPPPKDTPPEPPAPKRDAWWGELMNE